MRYRKCERDLQRKEDLNRMKGKERRKEGKGEREREKNKGE